VCFPCFNCMSSALWVGLGGCHWVKLYGVTMTGSFNISWQRLGCLAWLHGCCSLPSTKHAATCAYLCPLMGFCAGALCSLRALQAMWLELDKLEAESKAAKAAKAAKATKLAGGTAKVQVTATAGAAK